MKEIIILAVTSFLVGVQASRIPTVRKELEDIIGSMKAEQPWMLQEKEAGIDLKNAVADETSAIEALDEIQKIATIADLFEFLQKHKDVMDCSGNTCQWCTMSACFKVSYLPGSKRFELCATYNNNNIFCTTVPAEDFEYCNSVSGVKICLGIQNVKVTEGRICIDVKFSVMGIGNSFTNSCFPPW